jgi:hypothetical protein
MDLEAFIARLRCETGGGRAVVEFVCPNGNTCDVQVDSDVVVLVERT